LSTDDKHAEHVTCLAGSNLESCTVQLFGCCRQPAILLQKATAESLLFCVQSRPGYMGKVVAFIQRGYAEVWTHQ
jgi:hypothetical protein